MCAFLYLPPTCLANFIIHCLITLILFVVLIIYFFIFFWEGTWALLSSHLPTVPNGKSVTNGNEPPSSSSSVALQSLQGPWPPHTGVFVILLPHLVGLPWNSDQPVSKASTYTGQYNTAIQRQTSMSRAGFEITIPATKRPRPRGHRDRQ
jgi:hypothetical protein